MPKLRHGSLNGILLRATNLRSLSIAVDYVSDELFILLPSHPLQTLELDDSGAADLRLEGKITPNVVFFAISDGGLENLRRVRVSKRLGWGTTSEGRKDVEELAELLEVKASEDAEFATHENQEQRRVPCSEAGVWIFD